ncbi:MAG: sigma factor-like helix-turn-helix DNA-binding protein [Tissierellia bacterium]|nr:sigma factor-like helix-turn-helix DNA-binding protein [Tissierellia bacterium]
MGKKEIINDIFMDYQKRLISLEYINLLMSKLDDKDQLRDSEEVYLKKLTKKLGGSSHHLEDVRKQFEKMVNLRNLLVSQLSSDEREIFEMRFDKGMKVYEISQELYISEATYYRKLRGIYSKLEGYYDLFEGLFYD